MQKTIDLPELRSHLETVVDEVADGHPYVLTRGEEPRAALVPYEDFRRLQELPAPRRFSTSFAALAGSWEDRRQPAEIVSDIEENRRNVERAELR